MSRCRHTAIWFFVVAGYAAAGYWGYRQNEENKELRSALFRAHQNQEQLNNNFRSFTLATEQHLSKQASDIQSINSRAGEFRAKRDLDSNAVIWE